MAKTHRDRIIEAAAALLAEGGRDAVSTRAVSAAAGVQAPALYRLFGDKQGLLDAVAAHGFESYLRSKRDNPATGDPVADLRRGWDLHVGFGLAHPALYSLVYGGVRPGDESPAAHQAARILAGIIRRIAEAGRLAMTEERATLLVHATGRGVTLTLISLPEERRDPYLSQTARESVIAAITTDPPTDPPPGRPAAVNGGPVAAAVALRAALPRTGALNTAERALLADWLDRIATG